MRVIWLAVVDVCFLLGDAGEEGGDAGEEGGDAGEEGGDAGEEGGDAGEEGGDAGEEGGDAGEEGGEEGGESEGLFRSSKACLLLLTFCFDYRRRGNRGRSRIRRFVSVNR